MTSREAVPRRATMATLLRSIGDALERLAPPPRDARSAQRSTPGVSSTYLSGPEAGRGVAPRVRLPDEADGASSDGASTFSDDGAGVAPRGGGATFPRVVWVGDPAMSLKLRKRVYPLGITQLTLGADLDLHTRAIALKWSWKDRFFGGRLRFEGNQLSLSKRFAVDSRAHIYVKAAYDVHRRKTLFALDVRPFAGFSSRSEDGRPGFAVRKALSLDRSVQAEVCARVQLPEARFSSSSAVSLGEGDVIVTLDEVNLRFMLH